MMCLKILTLSLVILAGGTLSTAGSELGVSCKQSLAQSGPLNQALSGGERCWLGAQLQRPRAAPQHHLFGVYPSRPGSYLRPYPVGDQGTRHAGRSKPDAEAMTAHHGPPDPDASAGVRSEAERPAARRVGGGPTGQAELLGDSDTYLGERGSKESLGKAGTQENSATAATITTFTYPKEPKLENRRKGWMKTRRRRQVAKAQAEGIRGDPDVSPRHFQPWPKHPLVHGVRTSPLEDSTPNGEDPYWEAETLSPHGGLPVLYFSGRRERLMLRPEVLAEIPREAFTVEAWVKPEGGQNNPAVIAEPHTRLGTRWRMILILLIWITHNTLRRLPVPLHSRGSQSYEVHARGTLAAGLQSP